MPRGFVGASLLQVGSEEEHWFERGCLPAWLQSGSHCEAYDATEVTTISSMLVPKVPKVPMLGRRTHVMRGMWD